MKKTITKITTQQNNKHRFNVFLDENGKEKYGFSVDEDILIKYSLRKGLALDESAIKNILHKDTLHKSYAQSIQFLSYRMRTKKEMKDYLTKKEAAPEHIPQIMERLEKEGYLDDRQFAEAFVRTRIQTSNKGPRLVQRELMDRGIAEPIAAEAVMQYTYELQYNKALKWATKKLTGSTKESFRKQLQQVQGTLLQKGFTQEIIQNVIQSLEKEKDEDQEFVALVHQGEKLLRKYEKKLSGFKLKNKVKEALFRRGFSFEQINQFVNEHIK